MKLTWKRTVIAGDELHHDFCAYGDNIAVARIMRDRDAEHQTFWSASVLATLATGSVAQTFPSDLPPAIACWNPKTHLFVVGYLLTVQEDGSATYGSAHLSAKLNTKRVVEPPTGRPAVVDCYGKTLDQLRAEGRLIGLKPTQ